MLIAFMRARIVALIVARLLDAGKCASVAANRRKSPPPAPPEGGGQRQRAANTSYAILCYDSPSIAA